MPVVIGLDEPGPEAPADRERLRTALESWTDAAWEERWLVLVGHGTFDGKDARFNLRGPDVTATELGTWLRPVTGPLVAIHTGSASAPFLRELGGTNRVVVSATRSGYEQNVTRLGDPFVQALADPEADLDQDGQVSVLEAFLVGSRGVAEFYRNAGRLATEHALLDDNGDGRGTPPEWFRGLRAVRRSQDGVETDGFRAHQRNLVRAPAEALLTPEARARRDVLEQKIAALRDRKESLSEEVYENQLEALLLELVEIYFPSEPAAPDGAR